MTESQLGVIPLGWARKINLFSAHWGCPATNVRAELTIDLEANFQMDATYAYYLSATFIPPGKPEAFAYFGMHPTAYIGLHLEGNAMFQMQSQRKQIIDTLTYPGLAVKGIAAVGPTLDIYGQASLSSFLHKYLNLANTFLGRSREKSYYMVRPMQEPPYHLAKRRSTDRRMTRARTSTRNFWV